MTYATPAHYIDKYGLDEAVQLLADEQRLLTAQLLTDALAGSWTGSPPEAEQAAATAGLARLVRQLAISSSLMDGYLASAITLPLAAGDANATVLEECCLALTRCGLADDSDNATDRADECCKTWRAWLKDVQARRVTLVQSNTGQPLPSGAGSIRFGRTTSAYDWGRFGGRQA